MSKHDKPLGLVETDTLEDAFKRADSVSSNTSYSGIMLHNKDLRRVVLLSRELRKKPAVDEQKRELALWVTGKLKLEDTFRVVEEAKKYLEGLEGE